MRASIPLILMCFPLFGYYCGAVDPDCFDDAGNNLSYYKCTQKQDVNY